MNHQRKNKNYIDKEVKRMKKVTVFLIGFFLTVGLVLPVSTFAENSLAATYAASGSLLDHINNLRQNWLTNWGWNFPKFGIFGELRTLQQEYKDAKQALIDEKDTAIAAVKDDFAQQKADLQGQLDEIGQEEQQAIDGVTAEYADQETELQGQIDTLKDAKSGALTALRDKFISDLMAAIKEGRLGDVVNLIKDYIADKKDVSQSFDGQIQDVQNQIADLETEKEAAIQVIKDAFAEEKQPIEDQIAGLDQQEKDAIAALEQKYKDDLAALQDEYKTKITDLWHEKFGENSDPPEWVFDRFFAEQKGKNPYDNSPIWGNPQNGKDNSSESKKWDLYQEDNQGKQVGKDRVQGTYWNKNDYGGIPFVGQMGGNSYGDSLLNIK